MGDDASIITANSFERVTLFRCDVRKLRDKAIKNAAKMEVV
ncbi:hypothetical protein [Azospirillum doebereinerae]